MANADDSSVSIYASARSTAAMRTRDHMLTHVESSRTMATGLSSGRILVVDNDPAVLQLISDYFGEHGIKTVSAKGRSAVARQLAGGDPSAIILDLRLGQDNGLDLLREIRKSSDAPIIILTGRSRDDVDCVVGLELRLHLIRFHGVLAPNAKLRNKIVPAPPERATETSSENAHTQGAPARMS